MLVGPERVTHGLVCPRSKQRSVTAKASLARTFASLKGMTASGDRRQCADRG